METHTLTCPIIINNRLLLMHCIPFATIIFMKFFCWMHNKFNDVRAHDIKPKQEEFLLTIGTLGGLPIKKNAEIKETEYTTEEVGKLLTKLVSSKHAAADLPLNRFLNCPSTLELDHKTAEEEDIDHTVTAIVGRCKAAIGKKKSVSFLLKKMLVCGSGFSAIPGIRDPLPESRMEKLLRAMLKNKINNPQPRKHLIQEDDNGSKWVKTDSEYIVLEI